MDAATNNPVCGRKHFKWFHIDISILPAKLAYFTDAAKRLSVALFLLPFLTNIGLNKAEASLIIGIRFIGSGIGGPFWGFIADKKKSHHLVFCLLIILSSLLIFSQVFLSILFGNDKINKCPTPELENVNKTLNSTIKSYSSFQDSDRKSLFFILLAVNLIGCFFEGSVSSFIDFATLRKIEQTDDYNINYGRQRLFIPVGIAFALLVSKVVIINFPAINITCYSAVFFLYLIWAGLCVLFSWPLFRCTRYTSSTAEEQNVSTTPHSENEVRMSLKKTCLNASTMIFFVCAFMSGALYAVYRSFVYVYLKEMDASNILLTVVLVMPYMCSIPIYFFEEVITKFLGGKWNAIGFSFAIFSVRFLTISFVRNPWLALIPEAMHVFTTPYFRLIGIRHIKEISPKNILATMCAIFNTLTYYIGYLVGSSIGGFIYEQFDGRTLYRLAGSLSGVVCVSVVVYVLWFKGDKEEKSTLAVESMEKEQNLYGKPKGEDRNACI